MSLLPPPDVAAPYPGLRPFLREESIIFFGRDRQIDKVLARLKTHQFLGIIGSSGCGKSSLVRAGMLPALESGLMGELGSSWFVADMKPGDAPLTNLSRALIQSKVFGERWSNTPEGIALLAAALRRSDVSLVNLVGQIQLPPFTNLLVLADQFEEIFRFQQRDANEALAFVNLLLATGRDRSAPIYVVLTMRTDFLGQCTLFPGLPEALNDSQYLCPRLSREELAEAIEGPAAVFGASVEPALVTQLLNDSGANSDQLPLVQHVLARIWHRRFAAERRSDSEHQDRVLRLRDYREVGGLNQGSTPSDGQNALSQHADEAYAELQESSAPEAKPIALSPPSLPSRVQTIVRSLVELQQPSQAAPLPSISRRQTIAQMLFRCLAERGASGQYVRRPVTVRHAAEVAGCSTAEIISVAEVFRRADRSFLVPPVGVTLTADSVLDISHEALIRQWQRFGARQTHDAERSWLEIEEESRRRYRRLAEAAENEATAGVLRDPELAFLNAWWESFRPSPAWGNACVENSFERTQAFLERSLAQAAADRLASPTKWLMLMSGVFTCICGLALVALVYLSVESGSPSGHWELGVTAALFLARALVIFVGARKARRLENYSLARMAAILAALPLSFGCLFLDTPVGLWLLVLLSHPRFRMRRYFRDSSKPQRTT